MASARKSKLVDLAKDFLERNANPSVTAELEKSLARKRVHQYNATSKSKLPNLDAISDQQAAIANTAALVYATRRKPIVELNWDFKNERANAQPAAATNVQNASGFLDVAETSVTEEKVRDQEENSASSDQNKATESETKAQFRQQVHSCNEDSSDMLFVSDLQRLVSFVLDYDPPRLRSPHTQAIYSAALESGALRDMVTRPPCVARVRYPANLNAVIVIVLRAVSAYEADRFPSCFAALRERGHIHCDFASSFATHNRCFDSSFLYYDSLSKVGSETLADMNADSPATVSRPVSPQSSSSRATSTQSEVQAVKIAEPTQMTDYDHEVLSRFEQHRARCRDAYDVRFVYRNVSNCTRSPYAHLDRVARTRLLCSLEDMREDAYPLPFGGRFDAFRYSLRPEEPSDTTCDKWYTLPDDSSAIFAIDCEMVETSSDDSALVRVSVVDESLECIYDTLVRPDEQVVDYRTAYSGVSAAMLESVHVRLRDVQRDLASLLPPNALLCGHSLNFDLHALQLFHPYVIDTSRLFARDATFYYGAVNGEWNGVSQGSTSHSKPSLRSLVARYLNETIQADSRGHSSIEDARATMRLVQLRIRGSLQPEQAATGPCDASNSNAAQFVPQQCSQQSAATYCCPDCFGMQRGAHKIPLRYSLQTDFYDKLRIASRLHRGSTVHSGTLSADAVPLFYRPIRAVSACLIDEPGCALDAFDARCTQLAQLDPTLRERTASWVVPDDAVASWSAVERLKQLGEYQRWVESSNYCANGVADGSMQQDAENQLAASTERSNLVYVHLHGFDAALRSGKADEQTQQERLSELVFIHLLPILNAARCHQANSLVLVTLPGRAITEADVRAGIADQVARGRCYISVS